MRTIQLTRFCLIAVITTLTMYACKKDKIEPSPSPKAPVTNSGASYDNYYVLNGGPYSNDTTVFMCSPTDTCGAVHWKDVYNKTFYTILMDAHSDQWFQIGVGDQQGTHVWTDSNLGIIFGRKDGNYFEGVKGNGTITVKSTPVVPIDSYIIGEFDGMVKMNGITTPIHIHGRFMKVRTR